MIVSREELEGLETMGQLFTEYAPNFKGASTPDESASSVLAAVHRSSLDGGYGGTFLSHNGTKRWM